MVDGIAIISLSVPCSTGSSLRIWKNHDLIADVGFAHNKERQWFHDVRCRSSSLENEYRFGQVECKSNSHDATCYGSQVLNLTEPHSEP